MITVRVSHCSYQNYVVCKATLQASIGKLLMPTLHAVSDQRLVHNALTTEHSAVDNTNAIFISAAGRTVAAARRLRTYEVRVLWPAADVLGAAA